jgi:hypothetical protein
MSGGGGSRVLDGQSAPVNVRQARATASSAQAGEQAIRDVVTEAGFTRFRRAAETPFNLVYEVRP